ncbi:MAG: response regulator [Rickettsiales bacterium]|nr:response regulator [Rickettsiales bacterium]
MRDPITYVKGPESLVILIVEDHTTFIKSIKNVLGNHEFHYAKTVNAAVEEYKKVLPDITILDINLMDGTGHEVMEQIRDFDPEAYIVMLTGSSQKEDIVKSQQAGVNGYILKPPSRENLNKYINRYYDYRNNLNKTLAEAANIERKEAIETEKSRKQNLLSVLVVNPSIKQCNNITKSIKLLGYRADAAYEVEDALKMIAKRKYDVIITEINLNDDVDGYHLGYRINQYDRVHHRTHSHVIGLGNQPKEYNEAWNFPVFMLILSNL